MKNERIVEDMTEFVDNMTNNVLMVWGDAPEIYITGTEAYRTYAKAISERRIVAIRNMIQLGDMEYPTPEINDPKMHSTYYTVDAGSVCEYQWVNSCSDYEILKNRLLWLNKDDVYRFLNALRVAVDKSNEK